MKWVLLFSLFVNGLLTWQLLQKKEVVREEVVEKVVVKSAPPQVIEKKVIVEVPGKNNESSAPAPVEFDEVAVEDTITDTNKVREDFLVGKLGLSEKEFKAIESVKQRYMNQYQKIFEGTDRGPLSLSQRKVLLQLEEEREAEYARTMGPKKWQEWESFRDNYNKKLFKRSMKEQSGVIVPMEI